ncbi:MAG: ABC transporter ATP-binding protein [Clostridiales bacterium]|nr:ABC transporter ATP-binding protein [Clostridiales bacterium]
MGSSWKEKLYEPQGELISLNNVKYDDELISIKNVDLAYEGTSGDEIMAIEDINFNIYRGEFVCVLGPSGCGKSTLLKILAGFIKPTSGEVELDGEKIEGTDWHRGVVFQNPPLFEWFSVRDNVAFGPKMRGIPKKEYSYLTEEYLEKVGLKDFADKKIYELSGGMKQRVSIARTLINDPEILLMDEPFGALDALTRENVQDLTRKIWWTSGKTIFFITHDVEEALLLASRIIVMSKHPGRVIEDISVTFSRQIAEEGTTDIKFTDEFYKYRERLLKLINFGSAEN